MYFLLLQPSWPQPNTACLTVVIAPVFIDILFLPITISELHMYVE